MSTSCSRIPEITGHPRAALLASSCAEAFHDPSSFKPARRALGPWHLRPWHGQEVAGDSHGATSQKRGAEPEVEQEADS
jgi:hypothetical protein